MRQWQRYFIWSCILFSLTTQADEVIQGGTAQRRRKQERIKQCNQGMESSGLQKSDEIRLQLNGLEMEASGRDLGISVYICNGLTIESKCSLILNEKFVYGPESKNYDFKIGGYNFSCGLGIVKEASLVKVEIFDDGYFYNPVLATGAIAVKDVLTGAELPAALPGFGETRVQATITAH